MDKFDLDKDYSASYVPLRKGVGYVAKGTVLFQGKPVEIFEAVGGTLGDAANAARAKAEEIHKRLRGANSKAKPSEENKRARRRGFKANSGPSKDNKTAWAKLKP